jgi:hypothetical protein
MNTYIMVNDVNFLFLTKANHTNKIKITTCNFVMTYCEKNGILLYISCMMMWYQRHEYPQEQKLKQRSKFNVPWLSILFIVKTFVHCVIQIVIFSQSTLKLLKEC